MRNRFICMLLVAMAITGTAFNAMAFTKDSLVWKKCTGCHPAVAGRIAKVQEVRTTPEEWTVIVDRMSRLYGMDLSGAELGQLLKELCATQLLSPAELDKVSYLNLYNNPQTVEQPEGKDQERMFAACVRCHSAGKILSYRMSADLWAKLPEFHLYQVPTVLYQLREMRWMTEAREVLETLARTAPYGGDWQAPAGSPAGSYLILGYEPGKGDYRGQATVKALGRDEYALSGTLAYDDGSSANFQGEGTLYGGHALRTRLNNNGLKTFGAYAFSNGQLSGQQHFPAPDFRSSTSTWYPAQAKAKLLKVTPGYLLAGETTTLRLEGVALPRIKAGEVVFSDASVQVLSAKNLAGGVVEVVAVYRGSGVKKAGVRLPGLEPVPVTLAPRIDSIKITPELGRARIDGGKNFPPEGVQFEALAFAGDLLLGPVPARFSLSAQHKRANDDDLFWVGTITSQGKQIPSGSIAPNPTREFHKESTGLVNVEAQYQRGEQRYTAKAQLAVTLPDFVPRIR